MGHCLWGTVSLSCLAPSLPCLHASACSVCKRPGLCPGKAGVSQVCNHPSSIVMSPKMPLMLSGGSSGEMHAAAFHQALEGLFRPRWVLWATRICFLLPPTPQPTKGEPPADLRAALAPSPRGSLQAARREGLGGLASSGIVKPWVEPRASEGFSQFASQLGQRGICISLSSCLTDSGAWGWGWSCCGWHTVPPSFLP